MNTQGKVKERSRYSVKSKTQTDIFGAIKYAILVAKDKAYLKLNCMQH
jgi:hypothetical protein